MKNQKGITLIALVITIIVLLILAGVSIAMLTGSNGILTQANRAGDATRDADIKEAISLAVSTINADIYDDTQSVYSELSYDTIAQAINKDRGTETAEPASGGITYTYNGTDYKATFSFTQDDESNNIGIGTISIAPAE